LTIYQKDQLYILDDDEPSLKKYRENPRKDLQIKLRRTKTALRWHAEDWHRRKDHSEMPDMFDHLVNPDFGEPILKCACYLHTGYFTSGAKKDLHNKGKKSKNTEEHWIPRTTVGKIIANAVVHGTDDYDALNGDCSIENIYRWIDLNAHLFCSVIISTKKQNKQLDNLTKTKFYSFPQLLNLEHYRDLGLSLSRNLSRFNKYTKPKWRSKKNQHLWDNPHLNPPNWTHLLDDSHFFPEILTPAMNELFRD